ncbi:MAG: UDP-glucose/GDP-mannose dehydrogenase family protein [Thermoleophilia bacterium]|nr:UDP-glucose/GDP-mannose dehydrogenase family protein [Thermoleophilia bacterium]
MSRLTVVGAGYVGLVTAACMAELGHQVTVLDVDQHKINVLCEGGVPIYEPGLGDLISKNRARLRFVSEPQGAYPGAEFVFLCVDTPGTPSGDADLSRIWQAVDQLPRDGDACVLIIKSTVPVGTGAQVQAVLAERGYSHIRYASNPEFLREGSAIADFMHPDRIVVGAADRTTAEEVAALYQGLDCPVLITDVASAEMIKYASNAFLATKISFINEIANVCEATGADVRVVAQGMGLDHRIGPHFLQAGIGYGGSCFPKDVSALKQIAGNIGYHFQLLTAVIEVNELQKRRMVAKIKRHLGNELRSKKIALLGLSFKPNTDDIRQAPSIVLAGRLMAEGAVVVGYDPVAINNMRAVLPDMVYAPSALAALEGAEACVLVTEWDEFLHLDWAKAKQVMARPLVLDGRNALDAETLVRMGFTYEGVGVRVGPA